MRKQEDRLTTRYARSAKARHEIAVARPGAQYLNVSGHKARVTQSRRHRFGRLRRAARVGVARRVDLDQLLIDVSRQLLIRVERRRGRLTLCSVTRSEQCADKRNDRASNEN